MFKTRQPSPLLIIVVAWLGLTASLKAAIFDLSSDFPTNSNPGGVWTFGWKTNVTDAIVPFAFSRTVPAGSASLFVWARFSNNQSAVQKNISDQTWIGDFGQGIYPPGSVTLYPGVNGADDNFAVIRFTAPSNGLYAVNCAAVSALNGSGSGDTDFHVVRGGVELLSAQVPASSTTVTNGSGYTNTLSLVAGQSLDFAVGRGLDNNFNGSALKIQLSITASAAVGCVSPAGSLAVWWKGESNLVDTISGNNGTGLNGLSWTNGQVGSAIRFDGVDDYATVPASSSLDVGSGTGLTVELWIKPDQIATGMPLVEWTTPSAHGVHFWIDAGTGTRGLFSTLRDINGVDHILSSPGDILTTSAFQHVALTYDKASGVGKIYLNGAVVASNFFGTIIPQTSYGLNLGKRTAATTGNGTLYKGLMDEISLYNAALSQAQIQDIFNAGSAGKCDSAPVIAQNPSSQFVRRGSNATFTVTATGEPVLHYQWLFNTAPITGASTSTLVFVATNLIQSGSYQVVVTNSFGSVTSRVAELQVVAELVRPTITVTAPAAGTRLTNVTVLAKGTAGDNSKTIKKVLYQLNGGSWLPATGTTNWSVLLNLAPGTNTFRAYSVDSSGNTSLTNARTVFRIVKSTLTIASTGTGSGQVVSNLNGKLLEIGVNYSVTATPASNAVFGGWTTNNGSRLFLSQKLTFLMSSNLVLHPIFSLENPFAAGNGLYQGLFSESNNVQHGSSGFLSFQLSDKGALSGKVLIDGGTHLFQGRMSLDGQTAFEISRPGKSTLLIALTADLNFGTAGLFTGSVTDGNWTAALTGGRALTLAGQINPGLTGRYTLGFQGSITGAVEDASFPGGFSVGTTTVGTSGLIQFTGTLADGTPVTQGANLNKDGRWPLYIPLYGGKGSVLAWITLEPTGQRNVSGQVNWIKPAIAATRYYPAGFNKQLNFSGSGYVRPATGQKVINLSLGLLTLTGGNMSTQILESLIIGSDNKIAISGVSRPTMTVNLDNGTFSGSFIHPVTRLATPLKGVFVQDETTAIGFFLGSSRSGAVVIRAP